LGLIVINPTIKTGSVDIVLDPLAYKPRKSKPRLERLLGEFMRRKGDPNLGGSSTSKGRMTAYRQRALALGVYLYENGATKASVISEQTQEPKARDILYKNYYGWFEKQSRGIYKLAEIGRVEIKKQANDK